MEVVKLSAVFNIRFGPDHILCNMPPFTEPEGHVLSWPYLNHLDTEAWVTPTHYIVSILDLANGFKT